MECSGLMRLGGGSASSARRLRLWPLRVLVVSFRMFSTVKRQLLPMVNYEKLLPRSFIRMSRSASRAASGLT